MKSFNVEIDAHGRGI